MSGAGPILLAAGGTGGHLFPAEALAAEIAARGGDVVLVTDARVEKISASFPARSVHSVTSATIKGRSPGAILTAARLLGLGLGEALALLRRIRPAVAVGFGGYPSAPPLAAAQLLRIPTVLHEQNAVMGRANRVLAYRATAIATGFPQLANARPQTLAKAVYVGNPVRLAVLDAAARPHAMTEGRLRLLVFGGSQGARVMSDVVPEAVALLAEDLRARLVITQQARGEDLERVRARYAALGVAAAVEPFFADLPERMADADLVVARAGASTVAELAVIGRASVLVPLPHSLDNDQLANATALADAGGAEVVTQDGFTPEGLAGILSAALAEPHRLAAQADAARAVAIPDAAARLADLVYRAGGLTPAKS